MQLTMITNVLATTAAMAAFIVMVYRLGSWSQDMAGMKANVAAELARYREESSRNF